MLHSIYQSLEMTVAISLFMSLAVRAKLTRGCFSLAMMIEFEKTYVHLYGWLEEMVSTEIRGSNSLATATPSALWTRGKHDGYQVRHVYQEGRGDPKTSFMVQKHYNLLMRLEAGLRMDL
jgi:hypothetical protein